ncbi:MTH938/NDUFAF3 family protein [Enterovirga sp.]|uniref:Mth938-like domain-containing protein n=1 Tax=Enterovirga sp. TaxID=2026350 RepID=UPI002BA987C6|nr:MTH938/NDUFAF3 family protein [Enterovirga sp.]HMO29108.1 MTH938/NDUFAF3 family protein [Enterovirga sp.]
MAEPNQAGFVPGRHAIEAYGRGGFRFAGMSHRGSILILPSGIHAWAVEDPRAIGSRELAPVLAEGDRIEFLLIGTGPTIVPLPDRLRLPFRERGISVDTMQTGAAARTYNVLLAEDRRVAAALIAVA